MAPRKPRTPKTALVAATPAPAAAAPQPLEFEIDWSKFRTPDLLLMQRFAAVDKMTEAEKSALVFATAPMLDRMIVGGIPDLPIERYGDIVAAFFAKMSERGNPNS